MISKILSEGEAAPFGYGFVRHRFDYLGYEVAPLPLNYLIRWVHKWQQSSYKPPTKRELNAIKSVRELQIRANGNGYERGYKDGVKAGIDSAQTTLNRILEITNNPPAHKKGSGSGVKDK